MLMCIRQREQRKEKGWKEDLMIQMEEWEQQIRELSVSADKHSWACCLYSWEKRKVQSHNFGTMLIIARGYNKIQEKNSEEWISYH